MLVTELPLIRKSLHGREIRGGFCPEFDCEMFYLWDPKTELQVCLGPDLAKARLFHANETIDYFSTRKELLRA